MNRTCKIPGTTLKNRCVMSSVGVEALNTLLDGGAPNTSIIVLDELCTSKFSSPICRCFLAEALEEGQTVFVASPKKNQIKNLMENLPKNSTKKSNEEKRDFDQFKGENENMKIAWRYRTVPDVDSYIGQQQICKFDLSQKRDINLEDLHKKDRYFSYDFDENFPSYSALWEQLYTKLSSPEFLISNLTSKNLLRVLLNDFGSPLWLDIQNLPNFLSHLRAFSRYANCLIMITLDSSIIEPKLYKNFIRISDAVFRMEFVEEHEQKAMSLYQKFDGRFYVQKLPAICSAATNRPDCLDLIFELKKKNFEFKIFHLPPALGANVENKSVCQKIIEDF